ncbi:hypothetical protein PHYPSEUDO_002536 [Phytophthora pseudosyringae]|uniref:RanBP2-type domain-containing protein n=1 Tax=Phytophthora pseudosyringae TaxID=221518 RepID=A0A8T1VY18_9STRA|nr:hypothetical protein PHYPSEUDO_002536 [Phytophthora pseudosyringae]
MGRSRSRSLPRERSTRPRRSRSHDRRVSRRSRSPVDRRRRSRSRSCSPSIGSEDRSHKKHRKHSKQAKKEEKRRHKKHTHKTDKEKEVEAGDEEATTVAASEQVAANAEEEVKEQPTSARSFFEQLQKQEAAKEPVGTVHARAPPAPVSATAMSISDKWECSKAGCGHSNFRHAPACNKCGAMKRLTEWR